MSEIEFNYRPSVVLLPIRDTDDPPANAPDVYMVIDIRPDAGVIGLVAFRPDMDVWSYQTMDMPQCVPVFSNEHSMESDMDTAVNYLIDSFY